MRRALLLSFGLALMGSETQAQPPVAPAIREFDLKTTESLGRAIYRQDSAAWVATDALVARIPDLRAAHVIGWIVEDQGTELKVRFLRDTGQGLEAAYDVSVSPSLKTIFSEPNSHKLTATETAMFAARQTAIRGMADAVVCRPGYNTVVLKDPVQPGWLVWLLAPMPKAGVVPVGIHYRFSVSEDGATLLRRDALARACGDLEPPSDQGAGQAPVALGMTHLVSKTPVETEVFLELQAGMPFYIMTADGVWAIDDGHIRRADAKAK